MRNPGDQTVRKPYFWSHNLIFGHHLRTGPHFSSLTLKNLAHFGLRNLLIQFRNFLGDQIEEIWSPDLRTEPKDRISWYSIPVEGVVARNQ
jgi:hypothetical protein